MVAKGLNVVLVYSKYEFCPVGQAVTLQAVKFQRGRHTEEYDVLLKCTKCLSHFAEKLINHRMEALQNPLVAQAEADKEVLMVSLKIFHYSI